ncbi:MDR/zinc-dependent alcohol dehydrogenase-like family protein [Actinoallomurus spadix]|uniref:Uncharacterized protein n=1 Tax=Actinoallomurus spadix TaxID=79912 RepID=A0ABP3GQM7_9ACTN|nr:hypothetical protein [Actinoallomurus spadix]
MLAPETALVDWSALQLPDHFRALTVHKDEVGLFEDLDSTDRDPRRSLHVEDVAVPELGPGEVIVAVMASSINYNTVWSSIFEPLHSTAYRRLVSRNGADLKQGDVVVVWGACGGLGSYAVQLALNGGATPVHAQPQGMAKARRLHPRPDRWRRPRPSPSLGRPSHRRLGTNARRVLTGVVLR